VMTAEFGSAMFVPCMAAQPTSFSAGQHSYLRRLEFGNGSRVRECFNAFSQIEGLKRETNGSMTEMNERPTWRRVLREFVIFLLLGPVATAIVYTAVHVGIELYEAPSPAPYTMKPADLLRTDNGQEVLMDLAPAPNDMSACFGNQGVECETVGSNFYVYDWTSSAMHGKWYQFGTDVPLDRIQRTVYHTPLTAYVRVEWGDVAVISLIFGWLVGAGVWIFYRLIRFAITG
jgi:hypothetical protein